MPSSVFTWLSRFLPPLLPSVPDERILSNDDFMDGHHHGGLRVGDLLPFVGGCPRVAGEQVDLIYGYTAVMVERKGVMYYRITGRRE